MKIPYYSKEEKIKILEDLGYKVEIIQTWRSENVYHNKVEYTDTTCLVAYKPNLINIEDYIDSDDYKTEGEIGLKHVFDELMEKSLKTLITRQIINNNV